MREIIRIDNTDIVLGPGLVDIANPLEERGILWRLRDAMLWRWLLLRRWFRRKVEEVLDYAEGL